MASRPKVSEHEFKEAVEIAKSVIERMYLGRGIYSKNSEKVWDLTIVRDGLAGNPKKLVNWAKKDYRIQTALRLELAARLESDTVIPKEAERWLIAVLRDEIQFINPPANRPKTGILEAVIFEAIKRLVERGMKPSRNVSSPPLSASDAVAAALGQLNLPSATYDAVAHIWKGFQRLNRKSTK